MLAPASFSPNYKFLNPLLQTVKNETTVLILVFKQFLQTSIPPLISVLYSKGLSLFSVEEFLSHNAKKIRGHAFNISGKFGYRKIVCLRGEYHDFL